jgi:acylphosphatase
MIRAHLIIKGYVQGVGYRATTSRKASQLKIKGWIKNLPNGSVEAIIEGDEEAVNKLIKWCFRGPTNARVRDIQVDKMTATGEFPYFFVMR